MADVKVPPMLHKMSVAAQKAWYKKNKMEYPGAGGKEGRSAAQAKKDVGEINKKKARETAIAKAAASKKNKELVSSSERVRAMRKNADTWGGGLGGGLDRNRDIISYVRAGGTIKAGRLGEESMQKDKMKEKDLPFTPDKNPVRRGRGGPMSQAKWLAKQAMAKKMKEMGMKEEVEQTDEALLPKQQAVADKLKASELAANKEKAGYKFGKSLRAAKVAAKMQKEEAEYIEEKLTAADPASKWISDFVASDNPKFAGKTKKERIQMALGAYYAAKGGKNESIEFLESKKMKDYEDDMENEMDDEEDEDEMEDEDDEEEMNGKKKKMEEKYMGFKALKSSIAAKGGARDPAAVAAAIGRKKYGKEKFQAMAAAGKKANEALDPVGREDKDVDNDGDSDKTDMYLSKRRKAIGAAIRKKVASKMGK